MERLAKSHAERTNVRRETARVSQAIAAPALVDTRPRVATLRKLADAMNNSPRVAAQRKLAETLHNSPRVAALRNLTETMHNSPRLLAQRKLMDRELAGSAQLEGVAEEEELLQGQFEPVQRTPAEIDSTPRANNTGLPDHLKSGIESLSGISLDDVKVHYNSAQPAQLNALAYAQGSEIHVAPGQERHLPHEAWHVVQQAQGRVRPTMQLKDGVPVNDEEGLEREADVMGARATAGAVHAATQEASSDPNARVLDFGSSAVQRVTEEEIPLLKKRLFFLIRGYLTIQAEADVRHVNRAALSIRNEVFSWLKERQGFHSWSIEDAVLYGMNRYEKFFVPKLPMIFPHAAAEKALEERASAFYFAPHQIIEPRSEEGENCHGYTIHQQIDKFIEGGDLLGGIGDIPAVVFVQNGVIWHSGRLNPDGTLTHLLKGVGVLNSTIGNNNMDYQGRFTLPGERTALEAYLQLGKFQYKVKMMTSIVDRLKKLPGAKNLLVNLVNFPNDPNAGQRQAIIEQYNRFVEDNSDAVSEIKRELFEEEKKQQNG